MPDVPADASFEAARLPRLILWAGPKHSGKTTVLSRVIQTVLRPRFVVTGFVAPSRYEGGVLTGFDIVRPDTRQRAPLATRQRCRYGRCGFALLPEGVKLGMECLRLAAANPPDIVIVDEYGPLELAHQGWRTGVDHLIASTDTVVLLVVREELVDQVKQEYAKVHSTQVPAHDPNSAEEIAGLLDHRGRHVRNRWDQTRGTSLSGYRRTLTSGRRTAGMTA